MFQEYWWKRGLLNLLFDFVTNLIKNMENIRFSIFNRTFYNRSFLFRSFENIDRIFFFVKNETRGFISKKKKKIEFLFW